MLPRLPNPPLHQSIADVPEGDLVSELVGDSYWRSRLFGIEGVPSPRRVLQAQPLAQIDPAFRGDADIVAFDPDVPFVAAAFEAKRIKVGASAFKNGTPNKLQEFEEAVRQTNRLVEIGFAQVYLFVLVVVDSRVHNEGRYTYDGATPELRALIDARIATRDLHPRAGLMKFELTQSMDSAPMDLASADSHLIRLATQVVQSHRVTQWLIETR